MFGSGVQKNICTKMALVTGGWIRYNKKGHDLYSSPKVVEMIKCEKCRWAEYVAHIGLKRQGYRVLGRKLTLLGSQRLTWVDTTEMDLK
jgi:hypothetical protein